MPSSLDLRQHRRFEVDGAGVILYRDGLLLKLGLGKRNKGRKAIDLSEGGVRLVAAENLDPGTKVRIRIEVEKFKETIEATGVVRWCRPNANRPNEFFAGAMFLNLSPAEVRKIALMRDCVTSLQYKVMRETRRHQKGSGAGPSK